MAWEKRRGHLYYYRSQWNQGRVVKIYMGKGPKAEAAAREDAAKRAERAERRYAAEMDRLREEPAKDLMADFDGQVKIMLRGALLDAGYHQHDRGKWRKRRGQTKERTNGNTKG